MIQPAMPRARFAKLEPAKQRRILDVAAEHFATHGYSGASYNRIIEASGSSKGAMYYYFEDKADLYATVLVDSLARFQRLMADVPDFSDAEGFWRAVRHATRAGARHYRDDPHAAALVRGLAADLKRGDAPGRVAEVRQLLTAFLADFIARGQRVGALRDDLPEELMLSIALGLSEAIDFWMAGQLPELDDAELERLIPRLSDLYRRLGQP